MELKITQLALGKIAQMGRHETLNTGSEHHSLRVQGSIPVRGNFFVEFILLLYNSGRTGRMIYLSKTWNVCIPASMFQKGTVPGTMQSSIKTD